MTCFALNRSTVHSGFFAPACKGLCASVQSDKATTASVVSLRSFVGPSAIIGIVMSFIVDAVEAVTNRWSIAHIGKKGHKARSPLSADANSTASIMGKIMGTWVLASVDHFRPALIFRSLALAVGSCFFFSNARAQAAAGLSMARGQLRGWEHGFVSANTFTTPSIGSIAIQNKKRSKGLSIQLAAFHMLQFTQLGAKTQWQ